MRIGEPALELPAEKHKKSFIEAVREFQADIHNANSGAMGRYRDITIEELQRDFPSILRKIHDAAAGRNLRQGIVPESTFWLIEGEEFVGRAIIKSCGGILENEVPQGDGKPSKLRFWIDLKYS